MKVYPKVMIPKLMHLWIVWVCQINQCHNDTSEETQIVYNEYITNKGLMNSGKSSTALNDMLTDFVDYVDSFYGKNDPLYPLVKDGQPLSKVDILGATEKQLTQCADDSNELCTWGDGDSLDRERVRDILINQFNYTYKEDK